MLHLLRAAEAALLSALAAVPAILASPAVRAFIDAHPAWAVYLPLVTGLVTAVYKWLKDHQLPNA
jgi:hypothetical protein